MNVKDKKNRLFFRFFLVLALVTALTMPTDISGSSAWAATPASGSCGTNVTYTFDSTTGVLTISGSGNMSSESLPFSGKDDIKKVVIKDGVLNIGSSAFASCTGITSIEISDSVTAIGFSAFRGCTSLTSIYIPDSVLSIGTYAFQNCSGLKSVRLPSKLTQIKEYTFYGCSSLRSIKIPDSVTTIQNSVFQNCSSLTSITMPDNMTSLGEGVFMECGSLKSINIPYGVTMIGKFQFYNCDSLTSLIIPDSVTSIRDYAFRECDKLITITIPDSVTSIGAFEFYGCTSLTAIRYHGTKADWAQIDCKTDVTNLPMEYEYHPPGKILTSRNATCTSDGSVVYDCFYENCKYSIYEKVPATGHSIVQHDGKEPTSTEPGWEPYETCRNCYYTTYKEIPATGPEAISGELTVSIAEPVTGQSPQTAIEGEKYTGSIHWTPETAEQFVKDTEYNAEITLTPKDGYKFDSDLSITVNGEAAEGTVNEDGTLTFSVSFEATAALEYDGMQASKPEPAKKSAGKVVLKEQVIAGEMVEYGYRVKDSAAAYTWQDSSTFESLEAGIYDFAARVKENDVHSPGIISDALNLEVFAKPVISYPDLTNLTVGTEIKDVVPALEGGSGTGTFAMEGVLPGGLSFDETTGIISGTPNATCEAGSVSVKYTDSEGNVSDSVVIRYEGVKPIELKLKPEDIRLAYEKTIYTGTEQCPVVTIDGLVQDQDYTVSYTDNIEVGTATVTITGKGNYTGTASRSFEILRGCTVSGTVTSFHSDSDEVIIQLIAEGMSEADYEVTVKDESPVYSIPDVAPGTYTMKVIKKNHVTRTYTVVVEGENVVQDVSIYLLGDVNMDGEINVTDINFIRLYILGRRSFTDYEMQLADADHSTSIDVTDINYIRLYILGRKTLS